MTQSLTGSIQKKYEYSDYGQRSLDSKTEIINNEFGYNGEAHTADGLQYLRSRYYDPVTGVFISADSYRGEYSNPLSQNRYTYAHNNPYKYDDPTGHLPASGINKYAANALMDAGSGTSSKTTVKPLPKKTPANVTTDDYRATNIDEAHARNQQNAFTGSFTLLGSTNKAPVKDTVVPKEESKATGEQESESIGTVTTIVTEHDNTQPNGVETYETQNTETKVIDIKDVTKAIISGAVMAGIGMAVMGLFAAASIAAPIAAVAAAAVSGFSQSFVDANVGALVENKTLEEYGKSQGYATLAEYQNKLFHDAAIGAVVGAVLATAFVFGSGLIKNSITKMVGQEAAEHADETLVILSESSDEIGQKGNELSKIAPEKVKEVAYEATEKSAKTAQQVAGESGSVSDNYVYRALNQKDNEHYSNGLGLEAKNPNGTWSLEDHLVNGSSKSSWKNDPYISTTSDLSVAKSFNESGDGYGIIKIDMNKVSSISYKGYEIFPRVNGEAGLPYHYSVWQQEISVYQTIPFDAIVDYFK